MTILEVSSYEGTCLFSWFSSYHTPNRHFSDIMQVPEGYETWDDAIGAYIKAKNQNQKPDSVDPKVWNVFEIVAFKLIPEISV